ncbi:hypothetical protein DM860_001073 [Cuscuta australis]|uniref:Helitron helicase-like domain-containing protein n=1 Tax=Cuscuta australis TaxID=267555 RepID=A0A328DXC7_9ASTE|nr:hypothetical protein DM860_001073 [Cuscuta australis]
MDGNIDTSQNNGRAAPQFTLSGHNHHHITSLLPLEGVRPRFTQLYIYDTQNEIANRMAHFSKGKSTLTTNTSLVEDLKNMIDEHNVLAQSFRRARDFMNSDPTSNVSLRLLRSRARDSRNYNIPTVDEVVALVVGDFNSSNEERDIIVTKRNGFLQKIHETHTAFIPLQYPLLFPFGEDGYQENIPIRESFWVNKEVKRPRILVREFVAFRLHERENDGGILLNAQRLYLQFLVDAYTIVEAQRIQWFKFNQDQFRGNMMSGLEESVIRGDIESVASGQRIILPSSFTGGMRYMFNNGQDAMAICRRYGYPDLFITITCNPQWPEIARFMTRTKSKAEDRPDIESRVFKMKLDELEKDLKNRRIFGEVIAGNFMKFRILIPFKYKKLVVCWTLNIKVTLISLNIVFRFVHC